MSVTAWIEFAHRLHRAGAKRIAPSELIDGIRALQSVGLHQEMAVKHGLRAAWIKRKVDLAIFDAVWDDFKAVLVRNNDISTKPLYERLGQRMRQARVPDDVIHNVLNWLQTQLQQTPSIEILNLNENLRLSLIEAEAMVHLVKSHDVGMALRSAERNLGLTPLWDAFKQHKAEIEILVGEHIQQVFEIITTEAWALHSEMRARLQSRLETLSANVGDLNSPKFDVKKRIETRFERTGMIHRRGRLHVAATLRAARGTGGVPMKLKLRTKQHRKQACWLICDVSQSIGSEIGALLDAMRSTANALRRLNRKLRVFLYVNTLKEISFERNERLTIPMMPEGISHYGKIWTALLNKLNDRSAPASLIILGDGRNNWLDPREAALARIRRKVRHIGWINPEPRHLWLKGDSLMRVYMNYTDETAYLHNSSELEALLVKAIRVS